jgi:predicted alpha/beta-hydrolase family hydrolase
VPVLCFNGTRDTLCTPALMTRALETVTTKWDMHWLEGADHSFHVLKSSGRTDAQVLEEVGATTEAWLHIQGSHPPKSRP